MKYLYNVAVTIKIWQNENLKFQIFSQVLTMGDIIGQLQDHNWFSLNQTFQTSGQRESSPVCSCWSLTNGRAVDVLICLIASVTESAWHSAKVTPGTWWYWSSSWSRNESEPVRSYKWSWVTTFPCLTSTRPRLARWISWGPGSTNSITSPARGPAWRPSVYPTSSSWRTNTTGWWPPGQCRRSTLRRGLGKECSGREKNKRLKEKCSINMRKENILRRPNCCPRLLRQIYWDWPDSVSQRRVWWGRVQLCLSSGETHRNWWDCWHSDSLDTLSVE